MSKNKHRKRFIVEVRTVLTLDLDERLTPDDDWRKHFYDIRTLQGVAEHFAYNVVANGARRINQLDGFADRDESTCEIVDMHTDVDDTTPITKVRR